MDIKKTFLERIRQQKILAAPSTVTGKLLSPYEETRKRGEDEIVKLITSLVKFYKTTIFPTVREGISRVTERSKAKIDNAMAYKVDVFELYIAPELATYVNESTMIPTSPVTVDRKLVTIGYEVSPSDSNGLAGAYRSEVNKARAIVAIDTLNAIINGRVDITDVVASLKGKTTFSDITLLLNVLSLDAPEGTMGKQRDYADTISQYRNLFNYYAKRVYMSIANATQGNDLVFQKGKNYMTLFAPVLEMFYKQGGTIEAIYGFHLSSASKIKVQDALANKDLYTRMYNDEYRKQKLNEKAVSREAYLQEYTFFVSDYVRKNGLTPNLIATIDSKFQKYSDWELSEVRERIEEIVLDNFYPQSGARRIVDNMKYFSDSESDFSKVVGLAALDLTIELIANDIIIQ